MMGILALIYTAIFSWAVNRICKGKHIPVFVIEAVMGKGNLAAPDMTFEKLY